MKTILAVLALTSFTVQLKRRRHWRGHWFSHATHRARKLPCGRVFDVEIQQEMLDLLTTDEAFANPSLQEKEAGLEPGFLFNLKLSGCAAYRTR